jgi:hypothetical protein
VPAFAFDLAVGTRGQTVTAGAVSTGRAGFLTYGGRSYALDRATWTELERRYVAEQRRSGRRGSRTLAALGVDPLRWLRDADEVGEEDTGGVRTVHVRARVDVPALLDDVDRILKRAGAAGAGRAAGTDVPQGLTRAQRRAIAASVRSASIDVFTGKQDGMLRRLNVQVAFSVPQAARAQAGDLESGRLGLDLRLAGLNEPQEIAAPRDARPLSELTGAAPLPQGAGGSYDACLDRARGDLAKAQSCAGLLGTP